MKHKKIVIAALFLCASLGACNKASTVNVNDESNITVTEPAMKEDDVTQTPEVTEEPKEPKSIFMPTPPFGYYLSDHVTEKDTQPIELKMKVSEPNQITDEDDWFIDNELSIHTYDIFDFIGVIGEDLPKQIDHSWNDLMITDAFYDDDYIYCTYGLKFPDSYILNIYDAETLNLMYTFDFSNYSYSPDYIEEDYDFIHQKVAWATIKDNILYVCHDHMTYAKSSKNMNAYLTAIDLTVMRILWRTDALVCNTKNFLILDDVIITGYGFTDEPDCLYQVSIHTGKIIDKIPLKTAATYLIKKDNVLYVRTYDTNYEFDIIDQE